MSVVYVVAANESGPCKVGHASKPLNRLTEIQTGSPQKLALYGVCLCDDPRRLEARVHQRLAFAKMSGEWFGVTAASAWQAVIFEFTALGNVGLLSPAEHKEAAIIRSTSFDRTAYQREYMRDKRAADKIGITVSEYRARKAKGKT